MPPVNTSTMDRPTTLLSLPKELLTLIVMHLPLSGILKARAVCRALKQVCGTRQVWKHVFLRSLGVSIPKPFFLEKPLEESSPEDLEHAIRRWTASWLPSTPLQQFKRTVLSSLLHGRSLRPETLTLCPGGCWALGACGDGSIWSFDLSEDWTSTVPIEPELLIPGFPLESGIVGPEGVDVWLEFDWTSDTALGDSQASHCLTQFNFAIFICPLRRGDMHEPMHIDVWQVRIEECTLQLGEHLSSFREDASFGMSCMSLFGDTIAYKLQIVVVVDWREANGRTKDKALSCRCLFMNAISVESLHLLPGDRLLVNYGTSHAALYNWELDFPLSDFLAPDVSFREDLPDPVWEHEWPWGSTIELGVQQPFIVGDTIRMVIPTNRAIHGLTIKLDDYTSTGVQFRTLLKDESRHFGSYSKSVQLNRAVGMRQDKMKELFYAQYNWIDVEVDGFDFTTGLCSVPTPLGVSRHIQPTEFLYDIFTNRVVAVPLFLAEPQFCTIVAAPGRAKEEGKGEHAAVLPERDAVAAGGGAESSCTATQEGSAAQASEAFTRAKRSAYGFESDDTGDDSGEGYSSGESSWKGIDLGLGERDEGWDSDGHTDDEISWKGVGPGGEHSDGDFEGATEAEYSVQEAKAGHHSPSPQTNAQLQSDDDISWKGVGSDGGDWDNDGGQ